MNIAVGISAALNLRYFAYRDDHVARPIPLNTWIPRRVRIIGPTRDWVVGEEDVVPHHATSLITQNYGSGITGKRAAKTRVHSDSITVRPMQHLREFRFAERVVRAKVKIVGERADGQDDCQRRKPPLPRPQVGCLFGQKSVPFSLARVWINFGMVDQRPQCRRVRNICWQGAFPDSSRSR